MRSLPQWYRDEREKLRGYSLLDKLKYAWQYYKLWILGIGFVLGFTVYALFIYITVPGDIYFYGIFSNTYARLGQGSDFYNGFVEAAGYDSGLYASEAYIRYEIDEDAIRYLPLWMASYTVENRLPSFVDSYDMWQQSDSGRAGGVDGPFDFNIVF